MRTPLNPRWNLDNLYPGGSSSPEFAAFLASLEERTEAFRARLSGLKVPNSVEEAQPIGALLEELQELLKGIREAGSFTGCLMAENVNDRNAVRLDGKVKDIHSRYESALTLFDRLLTEMPDSVFRELLEREPWAAVRFSLEERRLLAKEKLDPELESLAGDLAVDGYHAWGELYNTVVSRIRIPFEEKGKVTELSAGQAANKLYSADREVRVRLFRQWEDAWAENADLCADALNHLGGFRLRLYRRRGWDSVHKEPLAVNRMGETTLHAMWDVIDRNKDVFLRYLERKAKLLGVERLSWHDVTAPIGKAGKTVTYDEGAQMIVEQFGRFSPKMAEFAEMALEERWVEAEDRPGKRPGGFCTSFPLHGQTRIFMTYAGTASNVSTLAHELGHGYHQHVMNDLPGLQQEYAMNVAETASTFAEAIVSDAAIRNAADEEEKLALLEDKLQNAVAFFMNIHARFIFETNFYAEREKGLVSAERLNELMTEAQKEAFRNSLSEYHPHFWASKLHFYITDVPFYNFPYTFGYLFSAGIYSAAQKEGKGFEDRYIALLRDTGNMTVEELALKHLGVNLHRPEFWQHAVDVVAADVEQFLALTE